MAAKKIHAIYTDDDLLLQAVKQTRAENYYISEVYTPFPVHGLDQAVGLEPTRLAITSFLYGLLGLAIAIDRKSTRLNSSHVRISYAVFCLKKKKIKIRYA